MKQKVVCVEVSTIEMFIKFNINFLSKKLNENSSDENYPVLASGIVQGLVSQLEVLLTESGYDLKEYWESDNGCQIQLIVRKFKTYCRYKMLYRLPNEKLN